MVRQRPSAADIARYAALNEAFLPTTATVVRTGLAVQCRITTDTRQLPVAGLPDWYRIPRYRIAFAVDENVQVGDHLVTSSRYCLTEDDNTESFAYATATVAVQFMTSGTGSVKRNPQSITPGQTAGLTTVVPDATFRNVTPMLLAPVNSQFVSDTFGVDIVQPAWTLMDYPANSTVRFPVQVGDIVTIGTARYPVRMVLPTTGFQIVYVDVSRSG